MEQTYYSANKGIKLFPDPLQAEFLDKCIYAYINIYNWALEKEIDQAILYESGDHNHQYLTAFDLTKSFTELRNQDQFIKSIPRHTLENAIIDAVNAFQISRQNFNYNTPSFRTINTLYSTFRTRADRFYFNDNFIKIEGVSPIKTNYHSNYNRNDNIKFINPTIIRNNRTKEYSLTYVVEKPLLTSYFIDNNISISEPIGVDVNKRIMYACSNGLNIEFVDTSRIEKHINEYNKRIQEDRDRYNKQLKNNPNTVMSNSSLIRLNKRKALYEHLANIHKDRAYKGSLEIIRLRPEVIIMETLNLTDILSPHYISCQLHHHPLGIAQRILAEQSYKYNIPVIYAPGNFQSSNICSNCGYYKNILSNPIFNCPQCGSKMNRDTNAAINLRNWYINSKNQQAQLQ